LHGCYCFTLLKNWRKKKLPRIFANFDRIGCKLTKYLLYTDFKISCISIAVLCLDACLLLTWIGYIQYEINWKEFA
jgi:hypothetical protein